MTNSWWWKVAEDNLKVHFDILSGVFKHLSQSSSVGGAYSCHHMSMNEPDQYWTFISYVNTDIDRV